MDSRRQILFFFFLIIILLSKEKLMFSNVCTNFPKIFNREIKVREIMKSTTEYFSRQLQQLMKNEFSNNTIEISTLSF